MSLTPPRTARVGESKRTPIFFSALGHQPFEVVASWRGPNISQKQFLKATLEGGSGAYTLPAPEVQVLYRPDEKVILAAPGVTLHPATAARYRTQVLGLRAALTDGDRSIEAAVIIRGLIDRSKRPVNAVFH